MVRLGDGLAFLAADALGVFANQADALALVRLRRVVGADLGSDLADELLVDALDLDLRAVVDGDFDALRNVVEDRVRVAEREVDLLALERGLEADALDFEFLRVAERAVPYMAREKRVSSVLETVSLPSFCSILTTGAKVLETLPLGPSTDTVVPLMSTLTLSGI